ncbi:hypothetical protein EXE44_04750 [Halorubrum sp. SS7]|uniref:hypothetical protein n=2 Tax=unclassified Halorubrum TaxID=2642239 RepID=UPI0010F70045|nr:hypothetical protein [Halorubrum sp. SS7]TKX58855.1 hypothetical protein EXE44_04750 [Halorubrum sp. SS7]
MGDAPRNAAGAEPTHDYGGADTTNDRRDILDGDERVETLEETPRSPPDAQEYAEMAEDYQDKNAEIDWDEMSTIPMMERDTIRMEVAVDVSDMDTQGKKAINELTDLYEGAFQEVVNKNRDYSWSFLRTGRKLADTPATPFEDPARSQAFGLLTRMGDKHERLVENVYGNGDAAVSDTPDVTAQEMANYAMFLAFVLANPDLATEL